GRTGAAHVQRRTRSANAAQRPAGRTAGPETPADAGQPPLARTACRADPAVQRACRVACVTAERSAGTGQRLQRAVRAVPQPARPHAARPVLRGVAVLPVGGVLWRAFAV